MFGQGIPHSQHHLALQQHGRVRDGGRQGLGFRRVDDRSYFGRSRRTTFLLRRRKRSPTEGSVGSAQRRFEDDDSTRTRRFNCPGK